MKVLAKSIVDKSMAVLTFSLRKSKRFDTIKGEKAYVLNLARLLLEGVALNFLRVTVDGVRAYELEE